jgi:hypothetical protein
LSKLEQGTGRSWREHKSVILDFSKIFLLDITVGNKCNSACLMCNDSASSLWKKEQEDITGVPFTSVDPGSPAPRIFLSSWLVLFLFSLFDKLPLDIGPDIFTSIIYPISELPIKKSMQCNGERFTKLLSYMSLQKKYIKESFNSCISDFPLYQLSSYHTNIAIRNNMFFN